MPELLTARKWELRLARRLPLLESSQEDLSEGYEEDNWEYSVWTRWKRVAGRYDPVSSITALSTPSATYKIGTSSVPSSYLAPPCALSKQSSDPALVELEGYYQTMLWCELASYFNL